MKKVNARPEVVTQKPFKSGFNLDSMNSKADIREAINNLRNASNDKRGDMWLKLINHESGKEVFRTLLVSRNNQSLKMEALLAMQLMGDKGIEIMKEAFPKCDSWTRSQLVGIFAFLKKDSVIPELIQAVDDKKITTEKRLLALNALSNCSTKYEGMILKLLSSKDPSVRSRIARVVGKRRFERGRSKLKAMLLEEKDLGVLHSVIEALNDLGENLSIEEVMNLRDGCSPDKKSILRKLKKIAKKYGSKVYALVSAIIAIFISLGYSLASISSLLNIVIKNPSQNVSVDEEGDNENL